MNNTINNIFAISNQLRGSFWIIVSALFFATYGVWSKMMTGVFQEFNQAWIRGFIVSFVLLTIGFTTKKFKRIAKKDAPWFVLISLAGGLNQAPYYFAFQKLEIGTATFLFYASLTIGGFIFGKLFFQETVTFIKKASLFLAFLGMGLIYGIKLSGGLLPLSLAALAGLMGSAEVVFSKKISDTYSTVQILSVIFITMTISNICISFLVGEPLFPPLIWNAAWIGEICYSFSIMAAMYTVVVGFKYVQPSIGSLLGLFEIIFAIALGLLLFNEVLSFGIVLGGLLITVAAAAPELIPFVKKKFSGK